MKTIIYTSLIALGLSLPFASVQADETRNATEPRDAAPSSANAAGGPVNRNTANTPNDARDGIVIRDGVTYLIHNGEATRLDNAPVPEGFMRTLDGKVVPIPEGTTGLTNPTTDNRAADKNADVKPSDSTTTSDENQNKATKPDSNSGTGRGVQR